MMQRHSSAAVVVRPAIVSNQITDYDAQKRTLTFNAMSPSHLRATLSLPILSCVIMDSAHV